MDPTHILVLGLKGSVVAFHRDTGQQLWKTHLKSSMFVTVTADDRRVYAYTYGELFCLDLQMGGVLWKNDLPGLGYDLASLALPGRAGGPEATIAKSRQNTAAAAAGS